MPAPTPTLDELYSSLLSSYGPLMGNEQLWRALGFKTWAAFDKAVHNGKTGVDVFSLPGRKGRFALTRDVATWLLEARAAGQITHKEGHNQHRNK